MATASKAFTPVPRKRPKCNTEVGECHESCKLRFCLLSVARKSLEHPLCFKIVSRNSAGGFVEQTVFSPCMHINYCGYLSVLHSECG